MRAVFHRRSPPQVLALVVCALLSAALAGCATPPPASDPEALAEFRQTNDPLEPTNRVFYKVNDAIDTAVLAPAAKAYRYVLPSVVRTGIHNVLENIGAPVRLTNDILQGKPLRAGDTALRFVVNTTFGLGGLIDVGKRLNVPGHDTDFGLTLGRWGIAEGPFLYLPILGPSSPRDAVGFGTDIAIDPFTWIGRGTTAFTIGSWSRTGVSALDTRADFLDPVEQVKKTALDPYATFRSLYRQNRTGKLDTLRAEERPEDHVWVPGPRAAASPKTAP